MCCVLCAVCCVLCAVLCAVCCVLCAVCCVLCVVCFVLCVVCCLLFVVANPTPSHHPHPYHPHPYQTTNNKQQKTTPKSLESALDSPKANDPAPKPEPAATTTTSTAHTTHTLPPGPRGDQGGGVRALGRRQRDPLMRLGGRSRDPESVALRSPPPFCPRISPGGGSSLPALGLGLGLGMHSQRRAG